VMPAPSFAPISIAPPITWTYLANVIAYSLIFLLVRKHTRQSSKRFWTPTIALIVIGGLEASLGVVQRAAGAEAAVGTYVNKNHFAGLLEMILPFAVMYTAALVYRV